MTMRTLDSLTLVNQKAVLNDLYGLDLVAGDVLSHRNKFFMVERSQDGWRTTLVQLGLSATGQFERDSWLLPKAPQDLRILSVFEYNANPHFVLQSGHWGSIVKTSGLQLESVEVRPVLGLNDLGQRKDSFLLPEYLSADADRIVFDGETGYLSVAQNLWGVEQVVLERF